MLAYVEIELILFQSKDKFFFFKDLQPNWAYIYLFYIYSYYITYFICAHF